MSPTPEEQKHWRNLLEEQRRALRVLEVQAAEYGELYVPPHIVTQIERRRAQIADLEAKLATAPTGLRKISLAKLPSTSPDLFGRQKELALLDAAWDDAHTHVVSLVAFGGVGKTALVNKWLLQMGADDYRGAARVYGWSFYSQGAAQGKQASADPFIAAALAWFGDRDPTAGSPWDPGH